LIRLEEKDRKDLMLKFELKASFWLVDKLKEELGKIGETGLSSLRKPELQKLYQEKKTRRKLKEKRMKAAEGNEVNRLKDSKFPSPNKKFNLSISLPCIRRV